MPDDTRLILVVDDEPGTAALQRRRLERAGFRVEVSSEVDAAMQVLERGGVALVVVDYRLGTATGLDMNRRIRAAGFDVPVIIVSGALDDATVVEAMRAGVRDVVVKNLDYLDYLPDAVRGVLDQAAAVPPGPARERQGARVLIVEDDHGTATLERRQLERMGYTVDVAQTAGEAIERLRQGAVNLALVDLKLGDGPSGLDLYEQMKAEGFNIPAILVTGFPDQSVAIRALRAGIRDLVPKSNEFPDYLPAAVDRIIGQQRVEQRLIESELRLASIVGTAMDAIIMCDERLRVVLFNRSAEEMFHMTAAQALNAGLTDVIPALRDVCRPGSPPERMEVEAIRSTGERLPVEVSISGVVVHGRHLCTVIARDISERKRSEAELREADRRKDVFLGMLAHELRNPLAAIAAAGDLLNRTVNDPPVQRITDVVRRQTRALARMVDDLLDVSRVTLGKIRLSLEPLLLRDVVTRAAEGVREAATRGAIRLDVDLAPEPAWLNADATRVEQVLNNLLSNAVKFTPAGGTITVAAAREGDEAVIRVRDTGTGIEPALIPRVFELFYQGDTSLDRARSGLGIGLALVRQVVALHGGTVTAHSAGPGAGSEFVVRLPAMPAADAPQHDGADAARPQEGGMHVLVVDDQADLADCVALLVESFGHSARAVYDGTTALAIAHAERPDAMVVDIGMPGMSGYELAREVRRDSTLSNVRLIALTGYGRQDDRARVKEAGFDLHLTKPVPDASLRDALASLDPAAQRER